MSEFAGKICPVCKQVFTVMDRVVVCPDCGMPHHADCWEKNGGCSTFGCASQWGGVEEKQPATCSRCGAVLQDGQDFCPKCGTPRNAPMMNICGKCGATLLEGQDFCPKCGQRAGLMIDSNVSSAISQFNAGVVKGNTKKKKAPVIAIIVAVVAVLLIVAGIKIVPMLLIDTAGYIEQGDLEKAWDKAKTDEEKQMVVDAYLEEGKYQEAYEKASNDASKRLVMIENIAAVQSAFSVDNLKDPSSFVLRDVYYKEDSNSDGEQVKYLVLYISGANSYGASVSSYWLYSWDSSSRDWGYYCSVSDLEDEEFSRWDDTDDMVDKLINNLGRDHIKEAMNGTKLDKDAVKRINSLFERDKLDRVSLIDAAG